MQVDSRFGRMFRYMPVFSTSDDALRALADKMMALEEDVVPVSPTLTP